MGLWQKIALKLGFIDHYEEKEKCPNCGGTKFITGPEGGGSVNVQCIGCLKYYNYSPFGFVGGDRSEFFGLKPREKWESN